MLRPAEERAFSSPPAGKELREHEQKGTAQVLKSADVVCGTLTTVSTEGPIRHLPLGHFDVAIVDEAGQALEIAAWSALLLAPKQARALGYRKAAPRSPA